MTILFFTRLFYPHIGGVEKHVMEISERLFHKGEKIIIVCEKDNGNEKDREVVNGIQVYRIGLGSHKRIKKYQIWSWLWKNKKLIENADIIHCHDVFYWYLPFRFLYLRKRVYTTFHGYESYPVTKKAIAVRKISEKLSRGNICIGDFIRKWYHTKPTIVSYGGVDFNVIADDGGARQSHRAGDCFPPRGLVSSKRRVVPPRNDENKDSAVFIGRLDEQTGILTYNDAFKILRKKIPQFVLLVVGDGKYRSLMDDKTNCIGFKNNPEKYFQQYHYAFVSRYLSILEAIAAKRLVFAVYDDPVKEDYLKMAPYANWIVIEKDAEKLAVKVMYYMEHPEEEKKMIDSAYNWVLKQTWDHMTDLYEKLWKLK